jgi:hypothetical protein
MRVKLQNAEGGEKKNVKREMRQVRYSRFKHHLTDRLMTALVKRMA